MFMFYVAVFLKLYQELNAPKYVFYGFVDILNQLSLFSVPQNMIYKLLMLACGIIAFVWAPVFILGKSGGRSRILYGSIMQENEV